MSKLQQVKSWHIFETQRIEVTDFAHRTGKKQANYCNGSLVRRPRARQCETTRSLSTVSDSPLSFWK